MTESQKTSRQQTLQQERAAHAWKYLQDTIKIHKGNDKFKQEFDTRVKSLPAMIQSDGLGQALAFLKAADGRSDKKGSTAYIAVYNQLASWLKTQFPVSNDLLTWLIEQETPLYRRVSAETLAYFIWLKRFAEAVDWNEETGVRDTSDAEEVGSDSP